MGKLRGLVGKFLEILPIEDTQLVIVNVAEKIKPTKELVRLNYSQLSIFKDGDFVFYKENGELFIWFTKQKLSKKLHIPEAYLIYEAFRDKGDVIVLKKSENTRCVLVIKGGALKTQFCKKGEINSEHIELIKKRHLLDKPEFIEIEDSFEFKPTLDSVIKFYRSVDLNQKNLLTGVYEIVKTLAIIILFFINLYGLIGYFYVNYQVKRSKSELFMLQKKNKDIKEKFEVLKKEHIFFKKFAANELVYPPFPQILDLIAEVVEKNNGKIRKYNQYMGFVELEVISPSTSKIASELLSNSYFKDVQITSTYQYFKDKTKEIGNLKISLRKVNYVR